jgi:predicted MFS family arabinose efflux permease
LTFTTPIRVAFLGSALIAVTYGLARFIFGLFLPEIRADLGISAATAGVIGSLPFLSYIAAILSAPFFINNLGVRSSATITGTFAVLGLWAIGWATGPWILALGVVLCGISTGLSTPIMAEAVQNLVGEDWRGRVNAAINAATSLGVAAAAPLMLWFTEEWRIAYSIFGILGILATLAVLFLLPRMPDWGEWTEDEPKQPAPRSAWRNLAHLGILSTLMGFVSAAYWVFGPDLTVNNGGLYPSLSALIWLAVGIGGLAGTYAGDLIDRHGAGIGHGFSLAILAGSLNLLATEPGSLVLALTSAAMFGAAYMTLTGVYLVVSTRIIPQRPDIGPVIPFLCTAVGQVIGSSVAGWMIDGWGYSTTFGVFGAIGLLAALLSLTFPCMRELRHYKENP